MRFPHDWIPAVLVGLILVVGCGKKKEVITPDEDPNVETTTAPPAIDLGTPVDPSETAPPDDTSPIDPPPSDLPPGEPAKTDGAQTTPVEPLPGELSGVTVEQLVSSLGDEAQRDAASRELVSRGEAAVQPLVKALESGDAKLQAGAAFTLGRMKTAAESAVDELQKLADGAKDEKVRDTALYAIDAVKGQ